MPVRRLPLYAPAALALLLCGGFLTPAHAQDAKPGGQEPALTLGGADFDPNQPLKSNFVITVNVASAQGSEPDLSGSFVLDPTGSIQMKLIGAVPLKGLTPPQAADKIAALLKPYIKDPKVTVAIVSIPKPVVTFAGAIANVGPKQVNDNTTLAEALTILGYSDNGDLSQIRVTSRDEKAGRVTKVYNFLRWLKPMPGNQPDETQNPVLTDKDFVFITQKTVPGTGNVTVEGDVLRPGVVPLRYGVPTTLREIMSLAGGPNPTASRRRISLRRLGSERPLILDYDKMESDDPTFNLVVRPDDVIYVERLGVDDFINLNGAFIRAGRLPYQKAITLTQAIGDAGGLQPNARENDGRIFRHIGGSADPTKLQVIRFKYKEIRNNKEPDIVLEPGDTVEIPIGNPPRVPMDPLQLTTSLLSIAFLVDRLLHPNRTL